MFDVQELMLFCLCHEVLSLSGTLSQEFTKDLRVPDVHCCTMRAHLTYFAGGSLLA